MKALVIEDDPFSSTSGDKTKNGNPDLKSSANIKDRSVEELAHQVPNSQILKDLNSHIEAIDFDGLIQLADQ